MNSGKTHVPEATAVVSDSAGNLLFYSSGDTVWNSLHQIMQNGTGIGGGVSSTQMAIVPKPDSVNVYYLFTMNYLSKELMYAVIDMAKNSGLGKVRKKQMFLHYPVTEKIVACLKKNKHDYWLVTHEYGTNRFLSYSVTNNGIDTVPVISSTGSVHIDYLNNQGMGYMKISDNGKYLALNQAAYRETALFHFDNATGMVSNGFSFEVPPSNDRIYGIAFSPGSKFLYVATDTGLVQLTVEPFDSVSVWNSRKVILPDYLTGLQLGPDHKLYCIGNDNGINIIKQLAFPEKNYPQNISAIKTFNPLPNTIIGIGFPALVPFPPYQFSMQGDTACQNSTVSCAVETKALVDSVLWVFGDNHQTFYMGNLPCKHNMFLHLPVISRFALWCITTLILCLFVQIIILTRCHKPIFRKTACISVRKRY